MLREQLFSKCQIPHPFRMRAYMGGLGGENLNLRFWPQKGINRLIAWPFFYLPY